MERKIDGIGVIHGLDGLKDLLEEMSEKMGGTVPGYYGVSEQEFDNMMKQILCDQIMSNGSKTAVIDKHFKDCTPEIRAKIFAYHVAMVKAGRVHD